MDYSQFKPDFIIVPFRLIEEGIDPSAQRVYGVIYSLQQLSLGVCIASNQTIAEFAHCSEQSVERAISELSEKGYIVASYLDDAHRNRKSIKAILTYASSLTHEGRDPHPLGTRPSPMRTYKELKKLRSIPENPKTDLSGPSSEESELDSIDDWRTETCDDDGNDLTPRKYQKKHAPAPNKMVFSIQPLWISEIKKAGISDPPMKGFEYATMTAIKRDKLTVDDCRALFKYFFADKSIKDEKKVSFGLCLSETYIAQWRIAKKKKNSTFTQVSMAEEIDL